MTESRTQFDYLLNAFEAASQSAKPAANGYGDKRRAMFAYVRDLESQASQGDALDAKRYHWLRDSDACGDSSIGVYSRPWAKGRAWLCDDALDAAIDAAIATPEAK